MISRPMNVVAASALSVIAGIVAIASFIYIFDADSSDVVIRLVLGLLITVLFFATAGFLYKNGKGNYASLLFIEIINAVVIIVAIVLKDVNIWFGLAMVILAILVLILSIGKNVENWIAADRI